MHGSRTRRAGTKIAMAVATLAPVVAVVGLGPTNLFTSPAGAAPRVLHVGNYKGMTGEYASIGAAVNAAQPNDWILVGPGDYKERMDYAAGGTPTEAGAAVDLNQAGLHLRGMDRNGVVIDGTKPGTPQCSSAPADQDLGPLNASSNPVGRNGVETYKHNDVSIDNLTVCNFLNGSGGGNEIWWNGGDGSGTTNLDGYEGSYLTATSTYYETGHPRASYGIFVSNVNGPGNISHTYGANMDDGAYYIGACTDCNTVLDDAHGTNSALGYSGTNSGGHLIIKNSEFDQNKTGFSTNSQNNDDAPSPQDGHCPGTQTGPTGTHSCWEFVGNKVHDNNNPNVPAAGSADLGPPGTGIVISGGRNDIVTGNTFTNNGSWAILIVPFIDTGTPPPVAHCDGGVPNWLNPGWCYYTAWGNEISNNTFVNNGGFGNVTNGDIGELSSSHLPGNCYHGNIDAAGLSSAPANIESTNGVCGVTGQGEPIFGSPLSDQVLCATEIFAPCPPSPGKVYPRLTTVALAPMTPQTTMPDPCAGVPADPWCPPAPTITVTPTNLVSGGTFGVTSTGWLPGSAVTVAIGGTSLGTLTADTDGTVSGTFSLPAGADGTMAVTLTGTSYVNAPLTQQQSVTVTQPIPATPVSASPALTG